VLNAKYTDEDVRRSQELTDIALRYLEGYQGDFAFLVRAKNYLEARGTLPAATVRGILNCMRSDPYAAMLLPSTPDGRSVSDRPATTRRHLTAVPQRPAYVVVNTTWKMQYLLSTHKIAEVYHVLRIEYCQLRWYTHARAFAPKLYVWCSKDFTYSREGAYILTNDTQGRRICKGCHNNLEFYQEAQV